MSTTPRLRRLQELLGSLPFALDDNDAVHRAYARGVLEGDAEAHGHVEVWAYVFTNRYFLVKLLRDGRDEDDLLLDRLVTTAYGRIRDHLREVRDPDRFAHWVSVVCYRTFLNSFRNRTTVVALIAEPADEAEPAADGADVELLRRELTRAVERLPDALRPIARMRLLENRPYEEIAEATGHPLATARTYVHKSLARLRADPALRALWREWDGLGPDDELPP